MNKLPIFTDAPGDTETTEHEQVEIQCKVQGKPIPVLTWFRDGEPISSDKRIKISKVDDAENFERLSTLLIKKTVMEDESRYNIEAANTVGSADCEFNLDG